MSTNKSRIKIMAEAAANTIMKIVFLNRSSPSPEQGIIVGWTVVGTSSVVLVLFVTSVELIISRLYMYINIYLLTHYDS